MTRHMDHDEKVAYEAGWRASMRTTTSDLDAAEARFYSTRPRDFGGTAFAAGWVDAACDYPKWTAYADPTDQRPTSDAPIPSPEETASMALDHDHQSIPDSEEWNADTGETFGEARARFATFGPEVPAAMVPALVEAGVMVWSFGYGDDPEDFTTIEASDLDSVDWSNPIDTNEWAPFRIDALTPDAERILAGVEPTVGADEPFAPALEAAREAASLPSTDSLLRRTVVSGIADAAEAEREQGAPLSFGAQADAVLAALVREGFVVVGPYDTDWGKCPEGGQHHLATNLCDKCLQYDAE